ncbi:MAG: pyridoxal phosphate-dependent aminotransferase [Solirubrobacterales bacterium]
MGLLDYYRQFDDIGESEYNRTLRERRAREKALSLERVPTLDLSGSEWPELPSAEVVSASVYQARGRLNGYPDAEATQVRRALAERHNVRGAQIAIGNGAAELLRSAIYLLAAGGGEVVVPRPTQPLYTSLATRAGAPVVEPGMPDDGPDVNALARSVSTRTRVLVLCNPNDPTGAYMKSERLGELLSRLPEDVHVLLDESYVQFQDVEPEDACMSLVEAFPRLLAVRSFSRIYGLSGIRAGYAVGAPSATALLRALAPALGVNALTQAAMLQALRVGDSDLQRRRETVLQERARILEALTALSVTAPATQANFVWMSAQALTGEQLAARLEASRVLVADGKEFGDARYVRAAIRDRHAADRLLWALGEALGGNGRVPESPR